MQATERENKNLPKWKEFVMTSRRWGGAGGGAAEGAKGGYRFSCMEVAGVCMFRK